MKIGITLSKNAYTPEAYAYKEYLTDRGHIVQLDYSLDIQNDINIYFMGMRPVWRSAEGRALEIHEYQSLSTPPYAHIKNFIKKNLNSRPSGRIFLNKHVHKELTFQDDVPYIYRDMGVDKNLFQKPSQNPVYDILYCGSIGGRLGLISLLNKLAEDYKIVVIGYVTEEEKKLINNMNITLLGKFNRDELPEVYRNARYGLNFTPDIYPLNLQTSTKTLEYLASGLGLISNRYYWIEEFCKKMEIEPVWLKDRHKIILPNSYNSPSMDLFSWENILTSCNFENFLQNCLE